MNGSDIIVVIILSLVIILLGLLLWSNIKKFKKKHIIITSISLTIIEIAVICIIFFGK